MLRERAREKERERGGKKQQKRTAARGETVPTASCTVSLTGQQKNIHSIDPLLTMWVIWHADNNSTYSTFFWHTSEWFPF